MGFPDEQKNIEEIRVYQIPIAWVYNLVVNCLDACRICNFMFFRFTNDGKPHYQVRIKT